MATGPTVGRSREELLAAAAALTGAIHDIDTDPGAVACLAERAAQFEQEALDAPPMSAAGQVTDERLIDVIMFAFGSGASTVLGLRGMPDESALSAARNLTARVLSDPLHREEFLTGARRALAGRCTCGGHPGHTHEAAADEEDRS